MTDRNLRNTLALIKGGSIDYITDGIINAVKEAIERDKEEERLFCKEVARSKMKPTVENFAGGKITLSQIGRNFKGEELHENNLMGGVKVLYMSNFYETGNRHTRLVELFDNGKFVQTVHTSEIQLCKQC
jgi:CO dehydrogenase/acetyl-CoA synthase delta subunit